MIQLTIPIFAAQQQLNINKVNIVAINSLSGTTQYPWKTATEFPFSLVSYPSNTIAYFYIVATLDAIPESGKVLVWTFDLKNAAETQNIARSKVGFVNDSFIASSQSATTLANYNYDQYVLATTQQKMSDDTIRYTVTTELINPTTKNIIWNIGTLGLANTSSSVRFVMKMHIYDSVDDAAGSGTTPEEMRDVLSTWSEEELIPGIGEEVGDQIEDKVPGAVEDALNNHDQQQETQAGSKIEEFKEQLQETIDPYFENTSEIRDALHGGLTGVFGYSGTNAVITLPAANNPMADGAQLWPQLTVDLGYWWNQLPAALRSMITIYATFVILYCCLSEMLDTINTILIHRELLGLPDDEFGIRARSRGD